MYSASPTLSGFSPEQEATLLAEFRRIEEGANQNNQVQGMQPLGAAPEKPREGNLASANGTTWNPTGTAGLHEFRGGAWVKL